MLNAVQNSQASKVIRIAALLCGPDGTIDTCRVEIWEEQSSSGRIYSRCRITDEPPELPDGPYMVEFGHQSIRTNRYHEKWELAFLPPHIQVREAA